MYTTWATDKKLHQCTFSIVPIEQGSIHRILRVSNACGIHWTRFSSWRNFQQVLESLNCPRTITARQAFGGAHTVLWLVFCRKQGHSPFYWLPTEGNNFRTHRTSNTSNVSRWTRLFTFLCNCHYSYWQLHEKSDLNRHYQLCDWTLLMICSCQ